jgi:peptidoglycan/LPS O-acetylase OafA/YrhL
MPDRTAQAAVLGVALAGGVAVAVAPEAWDWSDTTVGLTLLAVLAGYYRRSWSSSWHEVIVQALAIAAVGGLCAALALMRPLSQQSSLFFLELWLGLTIVGLVGYLVLDRRADGPMAGRERS